MRVRLLVGLGIICLCSGINLGIGQHCAAIKSETAGILPDASNLEVVKSAPSFIPTFVPTLTYIGIRGVVSSQISQLDDLIVNNLDEYNLTIVNFVIAIASGTYLCQKYLFRPRRVLTDKTQKTSLQS